MASEAIEQAAIVSARLRETPHIQRLPSPKLELFTLRDFLPDDERARLIELIDRNRQPSTITDSNGDHYFRTSETCHFDESDPVVTRLEERLLELSGIDAVYGEPLQGQRYEVGQEFKAHTDYFEPNGRDYDANCSRGGNRTWTFMIYLNTPEAGGATRFKVANKMFQPEAGRLVCWNNRRADGSPNAATLHHAMKVRKGLKYVITKWYRELPYRQ
ncbi:MULTISPECIES: 2OG-Fe(II) oxygenase [unclassified Croceicoccus]|uniref:prolyl hydroxylase family protein n=1 Tax=unclassified Croceicoccus TaxID=2629967 RepID=UPI001E4AAE4B|nr:MULTISPECIES: 2OG-Fe(II) oxygenase [unclassified Croceicoccus]